jgi:FRG domain
MAKLMASVPTLESAEDTLDWVVGLSAHTETAIYRGQSKPWLLLPSLFRRERVEAVLRSGGFAQLEKTVMDEFFKPRAYPFLGVVPQSKLDWMVLAQHHGCPTRLLDWYMGEPKAFPGDPANSPGEISPAPAHLRRSHPGETCTVQSDIHSDFES